MLSSSMGTTGRAQRSSQEGQMETVYIGTTEVAKMIRQELKQAFPDTKFSVRSSKYSGGCSIDVYWTDGPTGDAVSAISSKYQGAGFDGMIDMKYSNHHYRNPDGSIEFGGTE